MLLVRYAKDKEKNSLATYQARHIYKKAESEEVVNVDTMKQQIDDEKFTREKADDINPYQKVVVNNIDKDHIKTSQMAHWSILDNMYLTMYNMIE